jgi:hypothetical protein
MNSLYRMKFTHHTVNMADMDNLQRKALQILVRKAKLGGRRANAILEGGFMGLAHGTSGPTNCVKNGSKFILRAPKTPIVHSIRLCKALNTDYNLLTSAQSPPSLGRIKAFSLTT